MAANGDYITDLVRRQDHDRFLTALFAPADRRGDVLALYAFNVELARIRESVSETLIGRMKLQWWRDTIEAIYAGRGAPKGHPVAEALAGAIAGRALGREHFEAIFTAREADMSAAEDAGAFTTVLDLEQYAQDTSGRLAQLVLQVLDAASAAACTAGRHAGTAYAMAGLARAILIHARDNRLYMPQEIMTGAGLSGVQDMHTQRNAAAIAKMVREVAGLARAHLDKARSLSPDRKAVAALLPATIAGQQLDLLHRVDYNVADPRMVRSRPGIVRLTWNAWRGRY